LIGSALVKNPAFMIHEETRRGAKAYSSSRLFVDQNTSLFVRQADLRYHTGHTADHAGALFLESIMSDQSAPSDLFVVMPAEDEPLLIAVERALHTDSSALGALPALTNIALGDPYLAEQLAELHRSWSITPRPPRGLWARLRTRLAWWLLGPEIAQANAVHATVVRLLDSVIVHLDQERMARRRLEEHIAYSKDVE
jgi:hypothetical protein